MENRGEEAGGVAGFHSLLVRTALLLIVLFSVKQLITLNLLSQGKCDARLREGKDNKGGPCRVYLEGPAFQSQTLGSINGCFFFCFQASKWDQWQQKLQLRRVWK